MPWDTLSRALYPRSVHDAHRWADMLWTQAGLYTSAIRRAVRYQVANYEIYSDDALDLDDKYTSALDTSFDLLEECGLVGDDLVGWGTSVTTILNPLVRTITCRCGSSYKLADYLELLEQENGKETLKWVDNTLQGICPHCSTVTGFAIQDRDDPSGRFTCLRWPLKYLDLHGIPQSNEHQVLVRLRDYREFSDPIKRFDAKALCCTPIEMIRAVFAGENFLLHPDAVCCLTLRQPCELQSRVGAWGLPMFLADFGTAMQVLLLDRSVEAIVSDMLLPFRLLTPAIPTEAAAGRAQGGPLATLSGGTLASKLQSMVQTHRMNPTLIGTFPIPVQETQIGGNAASLAPVELMEHSEHRLLDSMAVPYTLRSSSMTAAPPATSEEISLQLFLRTWEPMRNAMAQFAAFVLRCIGRSKKWESVSIKLMPQESALDIQLKTLMLQESANGKLPETLVYRRVYGLDWRDMKKRLQQEQTWAQRMAEKAQREMENDQVNKQVIQTPPAGAALMPPPPQGGAAGGMPPMGTGMPAPMQQPQNIEELMTQAQQLAEQLFPLGYAERRKALLDLKRSNATLHAQVKSLLEQLTNQAANAGVQAARSGQMQ